MCPHLDAPEFNFSGNNPSVLSQDVRGPGCQGWVGKWFWGPSCITNALSILFLDPLICCFQSYLVPSSLRCYITVWQAVVCSPDHNLFSFNPCLFLYVKFYWSTATPIGMYGCFCITKKSWIFVAETLYPQSLKYLLSGLLQKAVCQPLYYTAVWINLLLDVPPCCLEFQCFLTC